MRRWWVILCVILIAATAASAAPKYKVGVVFDLAGRGDNSFNDSAYNGLVQVAKAYKGFIDGDPSKVDFGTEIQLKYMEPKAGGQDREILMRALAEDGYNLIYGVGFMFTDSLAKVAAEFPKIQFVLIDGFIANLTASSNITCVGFKENEGSFLVGVLAAKKAKGAKIGFLGGMEIPLINRFENGFKAGAMNADPVYRKDGMILSQYVGKDELAFQDPVRGYNIASSLYQQGAAIVYHAAGGSGDGLFKAAAEVKKQAIGVDSDQGLIFAKSTVAGQTSWAQYVLTSMIKRVDSGVLLTAKDLIEKGKLDGGYRAYGLKEGGVGFAENDLNKAALAPYRDELIRWRTRIIQGYVVVPDETTDMAAYVKTLH